MNSRWLLVLLAFSCIAAAKKQPRFTVRFFTETTAQETNSFAFEAELKSTPRKAYFDKVPIVSEQHVTAIYPFTASDGTRGCAFQLDDLGRINLDAISVQKQGTLLMVTVGTRHVTDLLIDKRVSDGIITIPSGLTETEIAAASKAFPVMGSKKKK